jgi:hypothetical protein
MSYCLVKRVAKAVEEHYDYFFLKENVVSVYCFFCLQKVTAALRQLAYGVSLDYVDEYTDW